MNGRLRASETGSAATPAGGAAGGLRRELAHAPMAAGTVRARIGSWRAYALPAAILLVVAAPFYWIFTSSIKVPPEIIQVPPTLVPRSFTLEHYLKLFRYTEYPRYLANSLYVAGLTMLITLGLSVPAAYSLYRLRFPGREAIRRALLLTYIFPGILLLVPLYRLLTSLGLLDRLFGLVFVNVTFAAPFATWLLQAFFTRVPQELEESAALEGASRMRTLALVILPVVRPGLGAVAIYAFLSSWTEYLFASVLIIDNVRYTLPVGLAGIIGQYQVDWGMLAAGAVVMTAPVVVLFAFVGRAFVEGLMEGAIK
ncbi:MAG: carbohydrate ABC transporter permease [Bacillota bacterium]